MNLAPTSYEVVTNSGSSSSNQQQNQTKVIVVYVPIAEQEASHTEAGIVDNFQQLLQNCYDDSDLKMKDLAQKMQLSEVQLYRKIKKLTNQNPTTHLRLFRLGKALELLEYATNLTISEIAYQVGFNEPNYFSRVFSETFGVSPSEMRKQFKRKQEFGY